MGTSLSWQTDGQLVEAVRRRLDAEPGAHARDVAITASDGVVTLTGVVHSVADKLAAEHAAMGVPGVRAVANDIRVMPRDEPSDTEIARDALHALGAHPGSRALTVTVRDGMLTLEGRVESMTDRQAAEVAVRGLAGVKGVSNAVVVGPATESRRPAAAP